MKKKFLVCLLATAMVLSLVGCGKKGADGEDAEYTEDEGDEDDDSLDYEIEYDDDGNASEVIGNPYSEGGEWGTNIEGSAIYLDGKTAIVSVYLTGSDSNFTEKRRSFMKKSTKTALEFITEQAAQYNAKPEFVFDESDLNLEYTLETEDIYDLEMIDYYQLIDDVVEENGFDANAIREKYSADGIAYLFFVNEEGESFSAVHYVEDGSDYYNEAAFVYLQSYDGNGDTVTTGPSMYAYQLLTLFGAVPLEVSDSTYGYTTDMCNAVREDYADDIMISPLEWSGTMERDEIVTKNISPVTAYCLGLVDTIPELSTYPSFAKEHKATITDNSENNIDTPEKEALYTWNDEWDYSFITDDEDYVEVEDDEFSDDEEEEE